MDSNINFIAVIVLAFAHWLGDFVFQSDRIATMKSKSDYVLFEHTFIYSLIVTAAFSFFIWDLNLVLVFFVLTIFIHTITDYFTSRLNSRLYQSGQIHNYYVSIGFDQFLHLCQLLITFKILKEIQ